jgi:hypothetical protein
VRAKVVTVEPFGAIVQFSSGVKALCPLPHMSELDNIVKPPKKFKVPFCSFSSSLNFHCIYHKTGIYD